jgi:hypothetical protein
VVRLTTPFAARLPAAGQPGTIVLNALIAEPDMTHILVAYHSRTGYTRRVAEQLAQRLDAALAPIDVLQPHGGMLGYLRCGWASLRNHDVGIKKLARDPAQFDLVVIGTPVWAGHASAPARTFTRGLRSTRNVGFFCTFGGSGAATALAELEQDARQPPLATLAVTDVEIDAGASEFKLAEFVSALRARPLVEVHAAAA